MNRFDILLKKKTVLEIFTIGQLVQTLQPLHDDQYVEEAITRRKWGVKGIVHEKHDSHGLCFDVLHADGTTGTYDPDEIMPIEE